MCSPFPSDLSFMGQFYFWKGSGLWPLGRWVGVPMMTCQSHVPSSRAECALYFCLVPKDETWPHVWPDKCLVLLQQLRFANCYGLMIMVFGAALLTLYEWWTSTLRSLMLKEHLVVQFWWHIALCNEQDGWIFLCLLDSNFEFDQRVKLLPLVGGANESLLGIFFFKMYFKSFFKIVK